MRSLLKLAVCPVKLIVSPLMPLIPLHSTDLGDRPQHPSGHYPGLYSPYSADETQDFRSPGIARLPTLKFLPPTHLKVSPSIPWCPGSHSHLPRLGHVISGSSPLSCVPSSSLLQIRPFHSLSGSSPMAAHCWRLYARSLEGLAPGSPASGSLPSLGSKSGIRDRRVGKPRESFRLQCSWQTIWASPQHKEMSVGRNGQTCFSACAEQILSAAARCHC